MQKTLEVLNELESESIISRYAIGGAIGAMFYTEPTSTFDLDIFCLIPNTGILIDLGPLYKCLKDKGYYPNKEEQIIIEDIPVQFIVAPHGLEEEALQQAVEKITYGVRTRVFTYEHLLAIMVKTGRAKDIARISMCLESAQPDYSKLEEILVRYNLLEKWRKVSS